ncbi:tRNA dihydrouridine(20/20a) synthase DusA [Falsirhodobacter sp. 20TX0035]|uniref:tRNA dihydrouridine(20/20a) synthase DusA n=1 Tax=Falsirhodobacter sp. 20TX0035 TaxID=3022019 RepID=UPI003FA597B5
MIDWTDRHCRFFHRQMSRRAMLYTEMVVDRAIIHGPRDRLLRHHATEHPVALQLGGSDPETLAHAVRHAAPFGYDEVNLNVGCPSDRVQSGCFGAVLMKDPGLVARALRAMIAVAEVPVTVKCRIGVDDQDPEVVLPEFLSRVQEAGVRSVTIHARKAWLQGLSPKENREVPPLDYDLVLRMKAAFPDLSIALNGGVKDLAQVKALLAQGLDGVMVGRAAYHEPMEVLSGADALWGEDFAPDPFAVLASMRPYIEAHLAEGGRLNQITRHMLGLFAGQPGARAWRRTLSEHSTRPGVGVELLDQAQEQMREAA